MKFAICTACSTGIASTYMSAEALERAAKKRGHTAYVETQGALGIENEISRQTAQSVDAVIFATDVVIMNQERFENKPVFEFGVSEAIGKADKIIEYVEKSLKEQSDQS